MVKVRVAVSAPSSTRTEQHRFSLVAGSLPDGPQMQTRPEHEARNWFTLGVTLARITLSSAGFWRFSPAPALLLHPGMKKITLSIIVSAPMLLTLACGGGDGGGVTPAPTGPSPTPTQTSSTVNIVSSSGSGAFSPNPVVVPSGGSITWRNSTGDSHALVMSDGRPIATIAPGASVTTALSGSGGNFRCTNHPSMVGSINGTTPPQGPPPDPGY